MKLLFDNGTPAPLRRHLGDHIIHTAARMGWENLRNGDLLDRAEENGYEVLITTDQSIRYRQNLTGRTIGIEVGIVVLMNPRWPFVRLCTVEIREALYTVHAGEVVEVTIPTGRGR